MKSHKLRKKGAADLILRPLVRIVVWNIPFFLIVIAYIIAVSDGNEILKKTNAIESGLIVQSMQSGQGNLFYKFNPTYSFSLKDGSVVLSETGKYQTTYYDFVKIKDVSFVPGTFLAGDVFFQKIGSEIKASGIPNTEIPRQIFTCEKPKSTLNLLQSNLVVDPAQGGVDSKNLGIQSFNIANQLTAYSVRFKSITLTRKDAGNFASDQERLVISKNADLLIKIGVVSEKGIVRIFVPKGRLEKESAILGCIISNNMPLGYFTTYPRIIEVQNTDSLSFGNYAAVYVEIGLNDEKQSAEIAKSIFNAVDVYSKKASENTVGAAR